MPECIRCGAFTDTDPIGEYHYCADCREAFQKVQDRGVIVEHRADGTVQVSVTAHQESLDGGIEETQIDGLARGKQLADSAGLPALFIYEPSGSRWLLDEYLSAHPEIRADVRERLRRAPEQTNDTFLERIRSLLRNQ